MTFLQLLKSGGFTMYVLLTCSVISLTIIFERLFYFRSRAKIKREEFMANIAKELKKANITNAMGICRQTNTPFSRVVQEGLNLYGHSETIMSNGMERQVTIQVILLEKFTSIVGTIGSTAVYIGLFGTVLGIIRAFHDIAKSSVGGINVVINGISEALVCTAAGLCVAVPAVIAYNFFVKRIDSFIADMELCASETLDLLNSVKDK
ncbi:MAG: MotA/TolQ/ExbB proton channel family protein [Candidatus Omnitrophica bacterium]|nr:MotA/TolQ/ExbB proton channel family protein [Candidatus Omnitrophota bacterium]